MANACYQFGCYTCGHVETHDRLAHTDRHRLCHECGATMTFFTMLFGPQLAEGYDARLASADMRTVALRRAAERQARHTQPRRIKRRKG